MLGKLNLDEFAMGSSNETSYFGPVISPWRRAGSETAAGSRRLVRRLGGGGGGAGFAWAPRRPIPAARSASRRPSRGTVGIKPTYGRCSRWGIVAFASSLDQAGPIARTVRDAAILLRSMAGHDPKDTTSVERPCRITRRRSAVASKACGSAFRRNTASTACPAEIDALWRQGVEWLKEAGATIVDISLPHTRYALPAYYIVAPAEASSNLARYDGVRYGLQGSRQGHCRHV